jgi:transposase
MAWLGLVPGEHSSGATRRQGPITRCGNRWVRSHLVEAAWAYRYNAKVSGIIERRAQHIDPAIRHLAWRAQLRLTRLSAL